MVYELKTGESVAACDICEDELEPVFGRDAAHRAMKQEGWVRRWIDGVLMDVCTECQGVRYADQEAAQPGLLPAS